MFMGSRPCFRLKDTNLLERDVSIAIIRGTKQLLWFKTNIPFGMDKMKENLKFRQSIA